jgi:hypothetical protein
LSLIIILSHHYLCIIILYYYYYHVLLYCHIINSVLYSYCYIIILILHSNLWLVPYHVKWSVDEINWIELNMNIYNFHSEEFSLRLIISNIFQRCILGSSLMWCLKQTKQIKLTHVTTHLMQVLSVSFCQNEIKWIEMKHI